MTQPRYPKLEAVHTRQRTILWQPTNRKGHSTNKQGAKAKAKMARKSTPQPLTLADPTNVDDEHHFIDSSLSPKSPKSPRSPFRFTHSTKKVGVQSQGEQSSVHVTDPQQTRTTNLPSSQTTPSLSALQQSSAGSSGEERQERERPTRSGFFSNYKASKSSSRLQSQDAGRLVTEDSMSRDTDRPAMSEKVSSQEATRSDTTHPVSSLV